ncbi:MAG: hypothetical protein FWH27_09440 [Planctomycetaceae bacterium]|nr:hypothetical protein [Planctomycetaceae bacterium]
MLNKPFYVARLIPIRFRDCLRDGSVPSLGTTASMTVLEALATVNTGGTHTWP